jgi:hypothetical protein
VPAPPEPPALAALADLAERPRATGWSLRAALVRYAQPEPVRSSAILELVRRFDFALKPHSKVLAKQGPAVWDALGSGATPGDELGPVVGLLRAVQPLDGLGDELAAWATDPRQPRPDAAVDDTVAAVAGHLDELGVPREPRQQARARSGGGPRRRSAD